MIEKPFDQLVKDDIDGLVTNQVKEGRTTEYKQELPSGRDADKKEFLADVSSFANAAGGDLVYGVVEKRDFHGTRRPSTTVPGVGRSPLRAEVAHRAPPAVVIGHRNR